MNYASQAEMEARFAASELIRLTAGNSAGAIDAARIAEVLGEADNLINASVGVRYQLPLAVVPDLLVDIACDIARYRLYPLDVPEQVAARYKDARATLDRIADGRMVLEAAGIAASSSEPSGIAFDSGSKLFSRTSMRRF